MIMEKQAFLKMIEDVSPSKKLMIFHCYVCFLEGKHGMFFFCERRETGFTRVLNLIEIMIYMFFKV